MKRFLLFCFAALTSISAYPQVGPGSPSHFVSPGNSPVGTYATLGALQAAMPCNMFTGGGPTGYVTGVGQYLCDGTNWNLQGGGSGSVSSVALTTPSWLTVAGSPVTSSGTFAVTGTSETANYVLASPNGSAGALAPRALVTTDLPAGTGTVTSASVATANGLTGTVANATTTPAITVSGLATCANPVALNQADPSGNTDSTTALQTAINSKGALDAVICISDGTYVFSPPSPGSPGLSINAVGGLTIQCAGRDTTHLVFNDTAGTNDAIYISGHSGGITFRNCDLHRQQAATAGALIHITDSYYIRVEDNQMTGTNDWDKILIDCSAQNPNQIYISGNQLFSALNDNIHATCPSSVQRIADIYIEPGLGQRNYIENAANANIELNAHTSGVFIRANTITTNTNATNYGILQNTQSYTGVGSDTIVGNDIDGNYYAIYSTGMLNSSVSDNHMWSSNSAGGFVCIQCSDVIGVGNYYFTAGETLEGVTQWHETGNQYTQLSAPVTVEPYSSVASSDIKILDAHYTGSSATGPFVTWGGSANPATNIVITAMLGNNSASCQSGTNQTATANLIQCANSSGVTTATGPFSFTNLTASGPLTIAPGSQSATSWTTNGLAVTGSAATLTDTTGTGTIVTEAAAALPVFTINTTTGSVTVTHLDELYLPAPLAGGNVTATGLYSLHTAGGINDGGVIIAAGGATINGGSVLLNKNSNNTTEIGDGTTTSSVTVGSTNNSTILGSTTLDLTGIASNTTAQTGYLCWASSNGRVTYDGTNTCLVSARKYKKDIKELTAGLNEVLKLKPVSFYYKTPFGTDANSKTEQIGFIADDVEKVEPRLVTHDKNGDIHGVRYEQMTALLVKALQEQQHEISVLQAEVNELRRTH